jgi:DNA-binding response OmpR family regulator
MDGWGFAREVRRRGQAVPIVVMAPAADADRWAAAVAAAGVLPKPLDVRALLAAVERCCGAP